jgi:4-hydroxy-3-methylbut-2-enyl diphosphate reductase
MRILLASPRGFCAGVNMAIESLETALARFGTPVYVYHQIVHNRWVVEHFSRRGVTFVDDLAQVPEGAHLLFSAHGVAPQVRREALARRLQTIDATCPLVTRVHREAIRFAARGYTVILVGHQGHDEVIGVMGEVPEGIFGVATIEDVDRIEIPQTAKVAYLTQTTLSLEDANQVIQRLKRRFPRIVGPSKGNICYATQSRQQALRRLAPEADVVLVVGSQNSSNSQRLTELVHAAGVAAHLIDGAADIDLAWFSPADAVLITAGASAPESVVQECVRLLEGRFAATVEAPGPPKEAVRFRLPKPLRTPG